MEKKQKSSFKENMKIHEPGKVNEENEAEPLFKTMPNAAKQGGRSFVWDFFNVIGESGNHKTACCNLCMKVYMYVGGSTSSMRNHLFLAHSDRFDRYGWLCCHMLSYLLFRDKY